MFTGKNGVCVNIYADESMSRVDPYTKDLWHYIFLIIDEKDILLNEIIGERYCHNRDTNSEYYKKNNEVIHWNEARSANSYHICKRWFDYILDPMKNNGSFHFCMLGINSSSLDVQKFGGPEDLFNKEYNRFFRSALKYSFSKFFPGKIIFIDNIFHECGQQQNSRFFSWQPILSVSKSHDNIKFNCREITFLAKDHRQNEKANLLQLCDCFGGCAVEIIHGVADMNSRRYKNIASLLDMMYPLVKRLTNRSKANNPNSHFGYKNKISFSFFPKPKVNYIVSVPNANINNFYNNRALMYEEQRGGQGRLALRFND